MAESNCPLACTLTDAELQDRRSGLLRVIGQVVQEGVERENGFAYRFPASVFGQLAQIIDLERQCCAFLRFTLTVEPANGPIWLEITGPQETKAFIASLWS